MFFFPGEYPRSDTHWQQKPWQGNANCSYLNPLIPELISINIQPDFYIFGSFICWFNQPPNENSISDPQLGIHRCRGPTADMVQLILGT